MIKITYQIQAMELIPRLHERVFQVLAYCAS